MAAVAAAGLWLSGVVSAASRGNQIAVPKTTTKKLKTTKPTLAQGATITFSQDATLTCAPQPNGQPATCTAIAALVGDVGPLNNIPLATDTQIFTSAKPIQLKFGLSQRTLNLLYKHRGDPRCTVTVAIVNGSSPAGVAATGQQASTAAAGTGSQSLTPARTFFAYINVPPVP